MGSLEERRDVRRAGEAQGPQSYHPLPLEEEYEKEPAQRLKVVALYYKLELALMDLADRLQGHYPKKSLALLHSVAISERASSFTNLLDQYAEFKTTGYESTDHRLRLRIAKYKGDLETAIGTYKLHQMPLQSITRKDANAYRDSHLPPWPLTRC